MIHKYMLTDIFSTTAAVVALAVVFLSPGFLLGSASNVFSFRKRSASEKLLLSVVLSISVAPVIDVTVARLTSLTGAVVFFILVGLAALAALWNDMSFRTFSFARLPRETKIGFVMMAIWAVIAILSVSDLQLGSRLYISAALFDHSVRIPFVEAVFRTGVPPRNPFYALGSTPLLRYYYYWYVICALPMRIGLCARCCFNAGIVWAGFALASLIPLYLKYFLDEFEALKRKSLIGISLLLVTGLDLIPYALMWVYEWKGRTVGDMEWWDPNQVTSWFDSLIWVPHHIAALVACMTGFLLLSDLDEHSTTAARCWTAGICGLAFASTAGLSIFVAFVFAAFAVPWAVYLLLRRQLATSLSYGAAGLVALLLSIPFLADLRNQASNVGHRFVIFAVRDVPIATGWLQQVLPNPFLFNAAKISELILLYIVELGFFFFIAILQAKRELFRGKLTRNRLAGWLLFGSVLIVVSVLQSDHAASGGNDLGFRGILIVQFLLLVWAAPLVHDLWAQHKQFPWAWRAVLLATLFLGLAATAYQGFVLRFYGPLADAGVIRRGDGYMGLSPLGERTYLLRDGFTTLRSRIPQNSVVQYNPIGPLNNTVHFYSTTQAAAGDRGCGTSFGGDVDKCHDALRYLLPVFNSPAVAWESNIDQVCNMYSVNVLVATDTDPVWGDPNSWVWMRRPLVSNSVFRGIPCGNSWANSLQ